MKKQKYIYTLKLLLAVLVTVMAQEKTITLNTGLSGTTGNIEKIARDAVYLQPGFEYTAGSYSFNATTDPKLICGAEYLSNPVIGENRQLSTSKGVGSLPGSYSVSPTGALSYSIPIDVPPGVNGMAPSLSIDYNNRARDGFLGWGWNLSGVPVITRGTTSLMKDGYINSVSLSTTDRFFYNGQRLICTSGTYGETGSEYRTEFDNVAKIKLLGITNLYFEVHLSSGKIIEMGNTSNSRLMTASGDAAIMWCANKVRDLNGNAINYAYLNENGQINIDNISYAGNTIDFFYEKKTQDASISYIYGEELIHDNILKRIEVHAEGENYREYGFKYTQDLYSLLNEVTLQAGNGEINSTIINWSNREMTSSKKDISTELYYYKAFGDFNGDGLTDIFSITSQDGFGAGDLCKVAISNGDGASFTAAGITPPDNLREYTIGDFDYDGDEDIMFLSEETEVVPGSHPPVLQYRYTYHFYEYNSGSFTNNTSKNIEFIESTQQNIKTVNADFNGDGKTDILVFNTVDEEVGGVTETDYELTRKYFSSEGGLLSSMPFIANSKSLQITDLNGNGLPELCFRKCSHPLEYSKSTGTFVDIGLNIDCVDDNSYQAGDINGDGKTDILYRAIDGSTNKEEFFIFYSTGRKITSQNNHEPVEAPFKIYRTPAMSTPYEFAHLTDLNADGRSDIIRYYFDLDIDESVPNHVYVTPTLYVKAYLSLGNEFVEKDLTSLFSDYTFETVDHFYNSEKPVVFNPYELVFEYERIFNIYASILKKFPMMQYLDFNGDGNGDFVVMVPAESQNDNQIVYLNENHFNRVVSSVTNGVNLTTKFQYATLYDNEVYTKDAGNTPPLRTSIFNMRVVKNVRLFDNGTAFAKTGYEYKNATVHTQYGFLGFTDFQVTDSVTNTSTKTTFESIGAYSHFVPKQITNSLAGGAAISSTTLTNGQVTINAQAGTKYFQDRVTKRVTVNNLNGTAQTTSYNNFNAYGVPEETVQKLGPEASPDMEITTTTLFSGITSPWLPLRPGSITTVKKHKDDNETHTETTTFSYDTGSPHLLHAKTSLAGTNKAVTETYEYESFGGVKKITLSGAGGVTSRSTTYTYSPNNKFIATQTSGGLETHYTYDASGNLLEKEGHLGLKSTYTYDDFGQLVQAKGPGGNTATYSKVWVTGNPDILFYKQVTASGKGTAKQYYNRRGQLVKSENPGIKESIIKADYEYYPNGQLKRQTEPYISSATDYTNYTYDSYGRLITQTTPQGVVSRSYTTGQAKVSVTTPAGSSTKEYDNAGLLVKATDAGGDITYKYNSQGLPKELSYDSKTITMDYDIAGNRTEISDPDAGITTSAYNAYGELTQTTDARDSTTSFAYDALGRLKTETCGTNTTTYNYNTNTGLLESVTGPETSTSYLYDQLYRIQKQTETINGENFNTSFTYNTYGQVQTVEYPGGFTIENVYDAHGYLKEVKRSGTTTKIWEIGNINNKGQLTSYHYGNGITTTLGYDSKSRINTINAGAAYNWEFTFNDAGNLTSREDKNRAGAVENFTYDNLNRLTSTYDGSITYDTGGNISTRTKTGTYNYDVTAGRPHAVEKITSRHNSYDPVPLNITYNYFNKINAISDTANNKRVEFMYGPDKQRKMAETYTNGTLEKTKYYAGAYEQEKDASGNIIKETTYIRGGYGLAAVFVKEGSTENLYYVHTDYLGSIMALSNESGTKVEEYFYDAWGKRKNPTNWAQADTRTNLIIDRGYTGHEHLDNFGLINMNGRVYDPALGRFLSPDPVVKSPDYTQNLNRYSYVLNNPLRFVDPSGYSREDPYEPYGAWANAGGSFGFGYMGTLVPYNSSLPAAYRHDATSSTGKRNVKGQEVTILSVTELIEYSRYNNFEIAGVKYKELISRTYRYETRLVARVNRDGTITYRPLGEVPAQSNGLFQPVNVGGSDAYLQILKALSYAYHYTRKDLPANEMGRWKNKGLTMKDIINFKSADSNPIFNVDAWGRYWATFAGKSATVNLMINPDGAIEIYDVGSIPGTNDQIAVWMQELRNPKTGEVIFEDRYLLTLDYNNYYTWHNKALKLIHSNLWNRDF